VLVDGGFIGLGEPPMPDSPRAIRYQCLVRDE
jgi:hypothetical protein